MPARLRTRAAADRSPPGRALATSTTTSVATTAAIATTGIDRVHGRGQHEQHDHGQDDLHDLTGGAFPRHRPQPAADVARVATVADAAVHVARRSRRAA